MSRPNLRQTRQKQGEKGESRGLLPTLMVISKGCLNRLQLCFLFQILIGTKWKSTSMKSMLQDGRGQSVRQKHLRPNFANSRMAPPPGGGTRNELEKEAKRIEKEIDKKTGVVKDDIDVDDFIEGTQSSPEESEKKAKNLLHRSRGTRMRFENEVSTFLRTSAEAAAQRHQEKMELFRTIFGLQPRQTEPKAPLPEPPADLLNESDFI